MPDQTKDIPNMTRYVLKTPSVQRFERPCTTYCTFFNGGKPSVRYSAWLDELMILCEQKKEANRYQILLFAGTE